MPDLVRKYSARWILPIDDDPIRGGWIGVSGPRIVEVSKGRAPVDAIDLGDVAVMPGLVNAHTHLEFSDLDQPVGRPGQSLAEWIGLVVQQRIATNASLKPDTVARGMRESSRAGVSLIGEIATPPSDNTDKIDSHAIRSPAIVSMAEVIGLSDHRSQERFDAAVRHNREIDDAGWSPHAPYSTTPSMIRRCVEQATRTGRPLAMHVAESPAERELLTRGTGEFADALKTMGVWKEGLFPWRNELGSRDRQGDDCFVELIELLAQASRVLIIHANDLRTQELDRVAKHSHLTIVYCPRTHAFFGYPPHPVDECLARGIRVAFGTDSRASNPDLNLWSEVQYVLNHRMDIEPAEVLRMATINGAMALGKNTFGRIRSGCSSVLGTIGTTADTVDGIYEDCAREVYHPLPTHDDDWGEGPKSHVRQA